MMAPYGRKPKAPRGPLHCNCPSIFHYLRRITLKCQIECLSVFKRANMKRIKAKITRKTRNVKALRWTGKALYTFSVNLSDFTVWRHTWRENWVKYVVLTGNNAGLRTALSHTELRSSLRESHSFLSLPADTTMASSQGTSVSSNSFSIWT